MRHNPRGRLVKYNLNDGNEEGSLEEEDNDEEHDQHELDDDDDLAEDVKELVESDDVAENAHEDYIDDDMMIITDLDDDDDMENPYNVDYVFDAIDDDMDEEDVVMDSFSLIFYPLYNMMSLMLVSLFKTNKIK